MICSFFLDLFSEPQLIGVIKKVHLGIKPDGLLLVSDFQIDTSLGYKVWQKPLLWVMHMFFGAVSQLQSKHLQPIEDSIRSVGFELKDHRLLSGKLMFSAAYRRNPHTMDGKT